MKIGLVATALVTLLLGESCSSSKESSSSSASKIKYFSRNLTVIIDGKMSEWGDTLMYDNSTKCIYSIANDESALYIGIKASDRLQQMKIIQGGMEIWIDAKARKNKSVGIKFPVGGGTMEMPSRRSNEPNAKEMREQSKLRMLSMKLTGFKDGLNGEQSIYSNAYLKPVIEWDDKNNLVYELAIPFTASGENIAANLKNISIGIFIKGLKMSERMGGGRNIADQSQFENMSKDNSFWTKYTISKKQ